MQYTSVFVICCCVRFHEEYEYDTSCKMFVLQARTSCVIYYICARAHNEIINRKYIYISHFIVYILVHVCCGGFYIFYFAPLLPFHRYICMLYVQLTRKNNHVGNTQQNKHTRCIRQIEWTRTPYFEH